MTRIKDATFEAGSLTGTDGFTSTTGSPTLDTTSKVRGVNSARTNWPSATNMNGTVSGMNNGELFISFYFLIGALPSSGSPRVITLSNGSTQLNFTLSSAGTLAARQNTTALGSLATGLTTNTVYRVGIHAKVSTALANADGIYDLYFANGDTAFGAAVISSSTITMNTSAANYSSFVLGMNNGVAATGDIYWDSLRIDDTSMPAPDGGTDTPKTITITINNSLTITKNISKPFSLGITLTPTITRVSSILKTISVSISEAVSVIRNIGKITSRPITVSSLIQKNILKPVIKAITTTVSGSKGLAKTLSVAITTAVTSVYGKTYFIVASVGSTISTAFRKDVGKPVLVNITITPTIVKLLTLSIEAIVNITSTPIIQRSIALTTSLIINIGITFSKLSSSLLSTLSFRKNTGTLSLQGITKTIDIMKNSKIASILGINRKTLDAGD
jgi:hypothetical protein